MTNEKILEKLRKIRAHADSAAKIGSQAEAEAFAAMFQKLLLDHKLSATDIEIEIEEREVPIGERVVDWQELWYGARRIAWVERLAIVVGEAYFCKILVRSGTSRITFVGRPHETELAEYTLVTLCRAAEKLVRKEYQLYRRTHAGQRAPGFQVAFMNAFVTRIAQRFKEELDRTVNAAPSQSTALVRVHRAVAAVNHYMERYTKKASGIGQVRRWNQEGARRGREVADGMDLRGQAIKPGRGPAGQLN